MSKSLEISGLIDVIENKSGQIEIINPRKRDDTDKLLCSMDKWVWDTFKEWHKEVYKTEPTSLKSAKMLAHLEEFFSM